MNKEVEELLNKLGSMEDAPLIWINKKLYDAVKDFKKLQQSIDKAIEILKQCNVDIDSVRLCENIDYAIYTLRGKDETN